MKNNFSKDKIFTFFGIFWIGFNFLGIVLAILGLFYGIFLALYFLAGIALAGTWIWKNRSSLFKMRLNPFFMAVILLSFTAILLFSHFSTPTVFSGRDQGSFSEAAIRLSDNHKLRFSNTVEKDFFNIYGPGKALNFPGFNYTDDGRLTTQFPIGYTSWLAAFYSFFGLSGLIIANAVSFFIFLLSFYLFTRIYLKNIPSFIAFLMILTSFAFSWFFKMTLSENLALFLVWFGIFEFFSFLRTKDSFFLSVSLLSFSVLAFSRIEAFALLAVIFVILFFKRKNRTYFFQKIADDKRLLIVLGLIGFFYIINIFVNWAYYLTVLKGLLGSFSQEGEGGGYPLFAPFFYVLKTFNAYALLDSLIVLVLAILYAAYKRNYKILLPLFLVSPMFFYLFQPGISFDHPWILRRFIFSVVPLSFFYAVWFFNSFLKKRLYFYIFSLLMIINNLFISLPYLAFSENKELLAQTKVMSENFTEQDLVLVDQKATGDGFSMISGPLNFLFGKQAAYFFNPEDIKKINLGKFRNVYFIVPDNNLATYQDYYFFDKLLLQKDYMIKDELLYITIGKRTELLKAPVNIPGKISLTTQGKIYLLKK